MAKNRKWGLIIAAVVIATGISFILAGMNPFRASYLIIFGLLLILQKFYDYNSIESEETPKGLRFWWRKVLSTTLSVLATLSFCNFLLSSNTDDFKDVLIWLIACVIGGILFGTFSYFAHTTDCSEEEFEAKKKRLREIGNQYDKVVEDMKSENN